MAEPSDRGAKNREPAKVPEVEARGLKRMIRRAVLTALTPELESLGQRIAADEKQSARLAERAAAVERGLGGLVGKLDEASRLSDSRVTQAEEALRQAQARLDELGEQVGAAAAFGQTLEELRQAFLTVRAEFEALRDKRVPGLEKRLDEIAASGIGALQGEVESLRDARMPALEERLDSVLGSGVAALQAEVEGLRDTRIPALEGRLDSVSGGDVAAMQAEVEALRDVRIPRLEQSADDAHGAIDAIQKDVAELRDARVSVVEDSVSRLHGGLTAVQESLGEVRDTRIPGLASDVARVQDGQEGVQRLAEELRDERLPALSGRFDALLERLHEDLTATAGLVDRILAGEPLHLQAEAEPKVDLPAAFRDAAAPFMEEFRGGSDEIGERVAEYVPLLRDAGPALDLGCGRGELLSALSKAGIEASGIDGDPAMVEACARRGLAVEQADLLDSLNGTAPDSLGAITAIHVFEHLPAAAWMSAIEAGARALRSGGLLIVECPNPEALRVGGALFWVDPTHRVPIHSDAVCFVVRAVGLELVEVRYRRPFPQDQRLAAEGQSPEVRRLAERLDAWLSGPRDFAVIARKP